MFSKYLKLFLDFQPFNPETQLLRSVDEYLDIAHCMQERDEDREALWLSQGLYLPQLKLKSGSLLEISLLEMLRLQICNNLRK